MRATRIITSTVKRLSSLPVPRLISPHTDQNSFAVSVIEAASNTTRPWCSNFSLLFSSSNLTTPIAPTIPNNNDDGFSESDHSDVDDDDNIRPLNLADDALVHDVNTVIDILLRFRSNPVEMKSKIEHCAIKVSEELVVEVLSRVRNDWEAAFTFFLWSGKHPGYSHSVREYHAMISILCKMRKFDTAWTLIDEMRGVRTGVSIVTPQTLVIMIRRYCQVHDVARAINTFYAYKRFNFDVGIDEFHSLLSALCRYKNVQDAEHLMYCNKDVFPFNTKSFNIVLNGWCNAIGSPREAERVWREMCKRRVHYDVVSYASIISCYSKAGNLYKVLKLFGQMKEVGIEPDRKVYNAVIHALAKGKHVNEAINLMKTMYENGVPADTVTYNSLIKPLCKARKIDEARQVFDEMLQNGHSPTTQTYHAFFRIIRKREEVFALLEKMRNTGCQPTTDTYIMLIRKFCRWRQFDDVFILWNEMSDNGIGHDRSSYIVLIHGLFLNGKLEEAYKYYTDMKEKELLPDPKIDEMLQTWFSNKQIAECQTAESGVDQFDQGRLGKPTITSAKRVNRERGFPRQIETRAVVRERGFSFWDH